MLDLARLFAGAPQRHFDSHFGQSLCFNKKEFSLAESEKRFFAVGIGTLAEHRFANLRLGENMSRTESENACTLPATANYNANP